MLSARALDFPSKLQAQTRKAVEGDQPPGARAADTDSDARLDSRDPRDGGCDDIDDLAASRTARLHKAPGLHRGLLWRGPLLESAVLLGAGCSMGCIQTLRPVRSISTPSRDCTASYNHRVGALIAIAQLRCRQRRGACDRGRARLSRGSRARNDGQARLATPRIRRLYLSGVLAARGRRRDP